MGEGVARGLAHEAADLAPDHVIDAVARAAEINAAALAHEAAAVTGVAADPGLRTRSHAGRAADLGGGAALVAVIRREVEARAGTGRAAARARANLRAAASLSRKAVANLLRKKVVVNPEAKAQIKMADLAHVLNLCVFFSDKRLDLMFEGVISIFWL